MVVAMAGYATVAMLNANTAMAVGGMVTSGLFAVAAGLFHLRS